MQTRTVDDLRMRRIGTPTSAGRPNLYDQDMGDDEAGQLMGWSLETGMKRQTIGDMVEFPCTFSFKAVGEASEGFVRALLERVGQVLGREVRSDEHRVRESRNGRYQAVTLDLFVTSGEEVYSIYAALQQDKRVRFMF